jgi:hypothetical protein
MVAPQFDLVLDNEGYRVEKNDPATLVRVTRTALLFASRAHCNALCEPVQQALDRLGRRRFALILDLRVAVGRNDPEYESWFALHRRRMIEEFPRVILLMRTVIGKMHSERMLRSEKPGLNDIRITTDENEAFALALAARKPPSTSTRPR